MLKISSFPAVILEQIAQELKRIIATMIVDQSLLN